MALKRLAFGAATLSAARVFQLAASFLAVPFLARMLTPADFGVFAIGLSVVLLVTHVADSGLGRSLVRTSPHDVDAWSSVHWAVNLMTAGLGLIVLALAWPVAAFFAEPRLMPIMATLAATPVLVGVMVIPSAKLLQQEKFHWLAAAEFFPALGGLVVALWLALQGAGAWALVGQQLAMRILKAAIVMTASSFRPRLVLKFDRVAEHLRFAVDTMAWSLTMFLSRQADTLIVGKVLGAATLGLYNVAQRVMMLPVNIVGGSLYSVLYPRLVRLRHDNGALRELVLAATMAQAALVFPPIAAVAAASHSFFEILLSDRWNGAGELFTLMAVSAAIQTVVALNGSLLQAIERTGARLRLTLEYAVFWALTAFALANYSVQWVALGYSATTLIYLPRLLHLYLKPIDCSSLDFVRVLVAPSLVAIAIFAAHRAVIASVQVDSWPEIGLAALETAVGYAALLWFGRKTVTEKLGVVRALLGERSAPPEPGAQETAPSA